LQISLRTNSLFECKMAYLESEGTRVMKKFPNKKFSLWKFKMEMVWASIEL
jgi:hypothetical protein